MVKLGYKLMAAEHGPAALVRNTVRAEQAGFAFAAISDYFFPWLDEQGHAPFAWSVLGAAAQATRQIQLMTAVTCPIMRYHPAIIARGGDNGSAEREPLHPRARRPFDQVGVVLRPKPRDAVVHVHFECRRCIRNGLRQPLPRFCCATQLSESSGWPAMDHREIRIRADQPFRRLNHALVFASKIKTAGNVQQTYSHKRIARIEDGLAKEVLRNRVVLGVGLAQMPEPALIGGPGVGTLRRLPYRASQLSVGNRRGQSGRQCVYDLILNRENV